MSRVSSLRSDDRQDSQSASRLAAEPASPIFAGVGDAPAGGTEALAKLDAAGRIAALGKAFTPSSAPAPKVEPAPTAAPTPSPAKTLRRPPHKYVAFLQTHRGKFLKTIAGVVVVAVAGWVPVQTLLMTTSTEAVINARLITLRAPIEGQIARLNSVSPGTDVPAGTAVLAIFNPRTERGRLDSLGQQVNELDSEIKSLASRRESLHTLLTEHNTHAKAFRTGRIAQLTSRMAETRSEIAAATARTEEAQLALTRADALAEAGTGTVVALERARRDATVAVQTFEAARHRLNTLDVELSALNRGIFVGDSYNDRPQSMQRADDITLRLSEISADIAHREARLASLKTELAAERERYGQRSSAALVAPTNGSIWEVMTAPGESVVLGQDLVRLLDCSGLVVTATVGEAAYNNLFVGQAAKFRFRGESTDYKGKVISLTGVATAPANLAIQPAALAKEPYRVTVALPELAKAGRCNVGRTGRVTFGG